MGTCQLTLDGHLSVGGDGCGCDSSGVSNTVRGLSLSCDSSSFQAIKSTDCAVQVATLGSVGQNWSELPILLTLYQLLSLKSSAPVRLRIGAAPAQIAGAAGVFPATTINTLHLIATIDGVVVDTTFVGGSLSALQVAAQINQAAIAAGLSFLPASVAASGQLLLSGQRTGIDGALAITTGQAAIGLPTAATPVKGAGVDLDVRGSFLVQFADPGQGRIQISGNAKVEILAAGTP